MEKDELVELLKTIIDPDVYKERLDQILAQRALLKEDEAFVDKKSEELSEKQREYAKNTAGFTKLGAELSAREEHILAEEKKLLDDKQAFLEEKAEFHIKLDKFLKLFEGEK